MKDVSEHGLIEIHEANDGKPFDWMSLTDELAAKATATLMRRGYDDLDNLPPFPLASVEEAARNVVMGARWLRLHMSLGDAPRAVLVAINMTHAFHQVRERTIEETYKHGAEFRQVQRRKAGLKRNRSEAKTLVGNILEELGTWDAQYWPHVQLWREFFKRLRDRDLSPEWADDKSRIRYEGGAMSFKTFQNRISEERKKTPD